MCPDEQAGWQTNPMPCTALERVEQACAALLVLQQRVLDLEKWQAMQNGHLRSLDEGLSAMKEMVGGKLDDMRAERQAQIAGLAAQIEASRKETIERTDKLYYLLAGVLVSLTLSGLGLLAAHAMGKI